MKNIFISTLFLQFIFPENNYPIFLLHGFLGWGNDELNNYYYWGGDESLEQYLKQKGHEVYTLSVGPISPNRDRAIEVFYQIKGGQVDYGQNHSLETGMIQKPKGKQYPGFYKKWDENNPIHIIAHSQGGQTATKLELLLKQKILEEEYLIQVNARGPQLLLAPAFILSTDNIDRLTDVLPEALERANAD